MGWLATRGTATTSVEPDRLLLLATHGQVTGARWVQRRDSSWVLLIEELDAGRCRLIERSRTAITANKDTIAGKPGSARLGASAFPFRGLRDGASSDAEQEAARRGPVAGQRIDVSVGLLPPPAASPNQQMPDVPWWRDLRLCHAPEGAGSEESSGRAALGLVQSRPFGAGR
jgi:hypothetical protein